jgi:peptidoglycan/LPS O-acetylase OafA/YrhL
VAPASPPPHHRLRGIQAARGVAALLVVLYHAGRLIALPHYVGVIPFGGLFDFGHAGVDFFFVLSGFIICFVHRDDIGRPARLPRYLWRRATRIYPTYWAIAGIVFVLALPSPSRHGLPAWLNPRDLLLAPVPGPTPVGMAWSLRNEMWFYIVFALAILNARLGIAAFAAWAAAVLATQLPIRFPPALTSIVETYNADFIIGAAAALAIRRWRIPHPRAILLASLAAFLAVAAAENAQLFPAGHNLSRALFGLCSGFLVLGLVAAERQGALPVDRFTLLLGRISYSLYLIHGTVISRTAHVLATLGVIGALPGWSVFALVVALSLLAGLALHHLVEAPVMARQDSAYRWLAGRLARR